MKKISDVGEFGLIDEFRKCLVSGPGVKLGLGDDAAVLRRDRGDVLFTTDMLIEGRHFRLNEASAAEIGRKAMAVNVSDIAAMGGEPTYAVVAAGLPPRFPLAFVRGLYDGLNAMSHACGVQIVGGDTNASDRLVLSVALLGRVREGRALTRSGAQKGDILFVTGSLGGSYKSRKHLRFTPRLAESRFLVKNFSVHAMMDLSDGLSSDLAKIAFESGVGALVQSGALPLSRGASLEAALHEGEDFELLFALSPRDADRLISSKKPKGLARFHAIGEVRKKAFGLKILAPHGRVTRLPQKGFDHFS